MGKVSVQKLGEMKIDRLTGKGSMLYPSIVGKPGYSQDRVLPTSSTHCVFCEPWAQALATAETARVDGPEGWLVRSVANKWPQRPAREDGSTRHEVVVICQEHDRHFGTLGPEQAKLAANFWIDRARAQGSSGEFPIAFLNHGVNASATQAHPHSQVLGLAQASPAHVREAQAIETDCAVCTESEVEGLRVLDGEIKLWVPEAQVVTFEMRFAGSHEDWPGGGEFGIVLSKAVSALYKALGEETAYNVQICVGVGHWHGHLLPRLKRWSGQEILTGIGGVMVESHLAAHQLRTICEKSS